MSELIKELHQAARGCDFMVMPSTAGYIRKAVVALEQAQRAARTRPDYDLTCDECGAPHWIDTSIPSAIWNQIAEPHAMLCMLCIDERLKVAGLTAEAEFHFCGEALKSKLYEALEIVEDRQT